MEKLNNPQKVTNDEIRKNKWRNQNIHTDV